MIDNVFDRIVRNVLLKFRIGYDQDSWNRLEAKLDKSKEEDLLFDKMIAEKLKSYSIPYNSEAFKKFERGYLDEKYPKRRVLYYWAGIAATLLLIIYSISLSTHQKIQSSNYQNNNIKGTNIFYDKNFSSQEAQNSLEVKTESVSNYNDPKLSDRDFRVKNKINKTNTVVSDVDFGLDDYGLGGFSNVKISLMDSFNLLKQDNYSFLGINHISIVENYFPTFEIRLRLKFKSNFGNAKNDKFLNIENIESIDNDLEVVSFRDNINTIADKVNDSVLSYEVMDSIPFIASISPKDRINGFIAPSASIINTPNDLDFNIPGYNQVKPGYSAGLTYSFTKNNYEVESGMEFASINYSPRKNIVKTENSSLYLANIYYSFLTIPFNFKYHFYKKSDLAFYVYAGISTSMVSDSKYEFVETVEDNGSKIVLTKLAEELQKDLGFNQTLYAQKQYNKGIVDGGVIKNNFFLAASVGFGVRKILENGFSIYFEPQFKYNFNKFGPNYDNIEDFSFKLGLSKSINL